MNVTQTSPFAQMKAVKRPILAVLAGILLAGLSHSTLAQSTAAPPAKQSIQYRRIFVPQDRLSEAVPKHDPYLSIEKDEFERLMNVIRAGERGEILNPARLKSAVYQARLAGDFLVAGAANLGIEHQGTAACVLPLQPCNLAISSPVWHDAAIPQPALMGTSSAEGPIGVVVERTGSLHFTWSLRGERNTPDTLLFDLELPKTPTKQLDLDLPIDQVLLASRGVVSQIGEPVAGRQTWRLELGGQDRVSLRVVSASAANERRRLTLLRQATSYDFSPHGVQVASDWTIDVHHEPLANITLNLEPTLRLVMARLAGTDIPWTATTDAESGVTSVVLQLAEPIEGVGRVLQLKAVAPLETEAPWRLPRLHADGMFWAEGKTRLLIPAPLSLLQLTPVECRQTVVEEVTAPQTGEIIELEQFSSAAAIEVLISRRSGRLQTQQGVTIDASASELKGRVVADFKIDEGERFSLSSNVIGDWIIDSVESVPSGALQDWNLDPSGENSRRLSIELRKALTPTSPLRIIVSGRWRRPVTESALSVNDCRVAEFESTETPRRFALVRPITSLQLQTGGDATFLRLDPTQLDGPETSLFDGRWQGVLFDIEHVAPELNFRFQSERPRFSAEVVADAAIADRTLTESYQFHCIPESSRVDRLIVHFSEARDIDPRWTLDGESEPHLTARRLHPDESNIPDPIVGGETWEIALKRPLLSAFDLRAVRTRTFTGDVALSLAALPEAINQTCQINLASTGSSRVVLRANRLKRVPGGQVTPARSPEDRGSFTFDPERDVFAPDSSAITIAPAAKDARLPSAWVWSRQLETYLSGAEGNAHAATFRLENLGRSSTTIQVPESATVQAVWLDEQPVPQSVIDGFDQRFTVELPAGRRFPVVVVYYITEATSPWLVGSVTAAPPTIDLPVLASDWTVWMPPGYAVGSGPHTRLTPLSWSERLLGPLGRSTRPAIENAELLAPSIPGAFANWVFPAESIAKSFLRAFGEPLHSNRSSRAALEAAGDIGNTVVLGAALQAAIAATPQPQLLEGADSTSPWTLQIDEAALDLAGISASLVVSTSDLDDSTQRGQIALQSAGLALIIQPSGFILTSAEAAALQADRLSPLISNTVYRLNNTSWSGARGIRSSDFRLLSVEEWIKRPQLPERPWQFPVSISDQSGWTAYQFSGSPTELPHLIIVASQRMAAFSCVLFLISASLVWWLFPGRTTWYLSLLGILAVTALLVPPAYVPLTSSLLLGSLLAGCGLLVQQSVLSRQSLEIPGSRWSWHQKGVTVGLALLWVLAATDSRLALWAQQPAANVPAKITAPQTSPTTTEPKNPSQPISAELQKAEKPKSTSDEIFQVFIPVDAENKPVGTNYIISDRLRTLLQSTAVATAQLPPPWLLSDADYQLRLNQLGMPPRLNVVELRSTWKFRTFQRDVTIRLPLSNKEVSIVQGSARLNAIPVNPTWHATGQFLELKIPQPREYEFSLLLGPPAQGAAEPTNGVNFTVPKLATSRFILHLPTRTPDVAFPTARGAVEREIKDGSTIMRGNLGSTDRLAVGWSSGDDSSSNAARTEVEELHWLRVQPGAVDLYVRLKVKVLEGRIGQLRIAADPRLRLLPMSEDSPVASIRTEAGPVQTLLLDLRQPVSDQVTVDLRLLLAGASGIGNLRLPYVQMIGAQIKQRLFGVSLDDGLAAGDSAGEALASVPPNDFISMWGPDATIPQLAFRLPAQDIMWSLPIRPRESKTTTVERLSVGVDRQFTRLQYAGDLDTQSGFNFQHILKVPATMVIDDVQVTQADGQNLLAHWSQAVAGEVTVFLNRAVTGKHSLRLKGSIPTKLEGAWRIPQVHIQTAEVKTGTLELFRTAEVLVDVNPGPKMKPEKILSKDYYDAEWGRVLARYSHAGDLPDALLSVSVNIPEISPSSALITRLTRQKDMWQIELDYRLRVHKGLVDVIRFDIPNTWVGPFDAETGSDIEAMLDAPERLTQSNVAANDAVAKEIALSDSKPIANGPIKEPASASEPQVKLEILPAPTEGKLQLVITPKAAISDSFRVRIRGPLQVPAGERVRVPEFIPRGVEQLDRYVLLPSVIGARRWNWEVRGLKVSAPPANLSSTTAIPHSPAPKYEAYQVTSDRFEAVSKIAGRAASVALVRLADIAATVASDGTVAGVATFDLEPAGLTECQLELPANFQPVQLRVAGLPALSEPVGNGRWRVPLGPQQLPQRLEILYTGRVALAPAVREISLPAPVLWQNRQAIRIERTLWTVYNPVAWGYGLSSRKESSTGLQQELARMQSIASMLDSVETQTVAEHTPSQLELWYQSWATRLLKSYDRIVRETTLGDETEESVRHSATVLNQTQETAATRLGVMETLVRLKSQHLSLVEGSDLWPWSLGEQLPATHASFAGSAGIIDVKYPSATLSDLPWRFVGAFLVAAAFTGLVDLARRGWLQDFVYRWPRMVLLAAGLIWILCLTPTLIGWGIVLLCAISALWPNVRTASLASAS